MSVLNVLGKLPNHGVQLFVSGLASIQFLGGVVDFRDDGGEFPFVGYHAFLLLKVLQFETPLLLALVNLLQFILVRDHLRFKVGQLGLSLPVGLFQFLNFQGRGLAVLKGLRDTVVQALQPNHENEIVLCCIQ